jgi:hypothetical protein
MATHHHLDRDGTLTITLTITTTTIYGTPLIQLTINTGNNTAHLTPTQARTTAHDLTTHANQLNLTPTDDTEPPDPENLIRQLNETTRTAERLRREYQALTNKIITGLTTTQHTITMPGGLPACQCGLSLAGGDATGTFITHALATLAEERTPQPDKLG